MTIVDEIEAIRTRIADLQVVRSQMSHAHALEERRADLSKRSVLLGPTVRRVTVLRRVERLRLEDLPNSARASESLGAIATRLAEDPTKLSAGREFKTLLARLDELLAGVDRAVAAAWKMVRAEEASVDPIFLTEVEQVPGQEIVVAQLRGEIGKLQEWARDIPETLEAWRQYLEIRDHVQELLQGLDSRNFPDAVRKFFQNAQIPPGAPWSLFTDEVRQWLAERNLLNRLAIRIVSRRQDEA